MIPEAVKHVHGELVHLRQALRVVNAVANCDERKWYGGSRALQGHHQQAVQRDIAMAIRRLTDQRRTGKKARDQDKDLRSVYTVLEDAGKRAAAERLVQLPVVVRTRNAATYYIAHGKPLDAPKQTAFDDLPVCAHEMCTAFQLVVPDARFDFDLGRDVFMDAIKTEGLPVVNFPVLDIFKDPLNLAPEMRARRGRGSVN